MFYFSFTVPEGSNMFDIARLLESEGIMSGQDFLQAAEDPAPIHDIAPGAQTQEGFLFPSTYRVGHFTTPAALCQMMTGAVSQGVETTDAGSGGGSSQNRHARVDDRERNRVPTERPVVASVFQNRLADRHDARLRSDRDLRRAAARTATGA